MGFICLRFKVIKKSLRYELVKIVNKDTQITETVKNKANGKVKIATIKLKLKIWNTEV